jgi:CubicO group peptidase (beta-lactamase class C family)
MPSTSDPLPRTAAVIQRGINEGLHPGAQLYVSQNGQVIADLAFGQAKTGVPMRSNSLNLWMSASKPIAAVAIALLWEQGLLDLDDAVIRFIPEFGVNGKSPITLRHILTHTAGFRAPPKHADAPWDEIIADLCASHLEVGWIPGQKAGYHTISSWYILGEIVRRLDGRAYQQYVREAMFLPLGMRDSWVGMPLEQLQAYGQRMAPMHKLTSDGQMIPLDPADTATVSRPGGTGWGPIRELAFFYEMLRNRGEWNGVRLLTPQTVEAITARHRTGMFDETFKRVVDWALGFLLNSPQPDPDLPYGYGRQASPRTFGHGGAGSSGAFCDPEKHLVVAYLFNGQPGEPQHHDRRKALLAALYDDLSKIAQ